VWPCSQYNDDWTPAHLTGGPTNLYKEMDLALKGEEWREPGLVGLAAKLATSAQEHVPITVRVPSSYVASTAANPWAGGKGDGKGAACTESPRVLEQLNSSRARDLRETRMSAGAASAMTAPLPRPAETIELVSMPAAVRPPPPQSLTADVADSPSPPRVGAASKPMTDAPLRLDVFESSTLTDPPLSQDGVASSTLTEPPLPHDEEVASSTLTEPPTSQDEAAGALTMPRMPSDVVAQTARVTDFLTHRLKEMFTNRAAPESARVDA
jgi:hypothetical protein